MCKNRHIQRFCSRIRRFSRTIPIPDAVPQCKKNEHAIWDKIIRQRHLFSTDLLLKNKYLGPAPFTSPISPDSPGKIGRWIGWRIISEYMKRSNLSLHELLEHPFNGEQILKISKYKG